MAKIEMKLADVLNNPEILDAALFKEMLGMLNSLIYQSGEQQYKNDEGGFRQVILDMVQFYECNNIKHILLYILISPLFTSFDKIFLAATLGRMAEDDSFPSTKEQKEHSEAIAEDIKKNFPLRP